MDALDNIIYRKSSRRLEKPFPTKEEMDLVYKAALRAPDHHSLRPSRFIEITDEGLDKLSLIFQEYARDHIDDLDNQKLEKFKNAPYRAPMVIVLISNIKDHPKVPEVEQLLSTAAAAQNILLSLNAMGYGGIWRTGIFALNEKISKYFQLKNSHQILGYLYVGTPSSDKNKIPEENIEEYVTRWKENE